MAQLAVKQRERWESFPVYFNYVRHSVAPMVGPAKDKPTAHCNTDEAAWKYSEKTSVTAFFPYIKQHLDSRFSQIGKTGVMCHSNKSLLRKCNSSKENIFN